MTRSPASIYNPHQAVWDEGYAAGLAAGAETMRTEAARKINEFWRNDPGDGELLLLRTEDAIRALPLPTAPASGEGAPGP